MTKKDNKCPLFDELRKLSEDMKKGCKVLYGEDAKRFIEYMNRPPTKEEEEYAEEAKRIYENTKFTIH